MYKIKQKNTHFIPLWVWMRCHCLFFVIGRTKVHARTYQVPHSYKTARLNASAHAEMHLHITSILKVQLSLLLSLLDSKLVVVVVVVAI